MEKVGALYRTIKINFQEYNSKSKNIIKFWRDKFNNPPTASFVRNTQFSKIQHPLALKLDTIQTNAFASSFTPMTSRDWNPLPPTVFPATYNLLSFKTHIHKYLQLLPNPKISSYFHYRRVHRRLKRLYLFAATSCINIIIKKSIQLFLHSHCTWVYWACPL